MPSRCFASAGVRCVFGTALLIPNGMTVTHVRLYTELFDKFKLHLFCMNKDVVREADIGFAV